MHIIRIAHGGSWGYALSPVVSPVPNCRAILTNPSIVRSFVEGSPAGISEVDGEALEGVRARSVEHHGLCLLLGVSLPALSGPLLHVVPEAVLHVAVSGAVPAVVPLFFGGVAHGEVLSAPPRCKPPRTE